MERWPPLEVGEVHVAPESELLRGRRHATTTVPALGKLGSLCGLGRFTTREPLLLVGLGDRLKLGLCCFLSRFEPLRP